MNSEYKFGQEWVFQEAKVVLQAPDVLSVVALPGAEKISGDNMMKMLTLTADIFEKIPNLYYLADLGNMGLSPEARSAIRNSPIMKCRAHVFYGGNFALRVTVSLITRGYELARGHAARTVMFKTREEAQAWIAKDRLESRA